MAGAREPAQKAPARGLSSVGIVAGVMGHLVRAHAGDHESSYGTDVTAECPRCHPSSIGMDFSPLVNAIERRRQARRQCPRRGLHLVNVSASCFADRQARGDPSELSDAP